MELSPLAQLIADLREDGDTYALAGGDAKLILDELCDSYVDDFGTAWTRPTAWAYFAACRARRMRENEISAVRPVLQQVLHILADRGSDQSLDWTAGLVRDLLARLTQSNAVELREAARGLDPSIEEYALLQSHFEDAKDLIQRMMRAEERRETSWYALDDPIVRAAKDRWIYLCQIGKPRWSEPLCAIGSWSDERGEWIVKGGSWTPTHWTYTPEPPKI